MKRSHKTLEGITAFLSVLGAFLVSIQCHIGWIVWLVANAVGITWGVKSRNFYMALMYSFFTLTTLFGLWNYIITPYIFNK